MLINLALDFATMKLPQNAKVIHTHVYEQFKWNICQAMQIYLEKVIFSKVFI